MSTTYTTNAKLGLPGTGDTGWAGVLNADLSAVDALATVGALCVTTHEVPSASLLVDVAAGVFTDQSGAVQTYAGTTSYAITASSTRVLYLDGTASWALTAGTSYPATPHVRLATVVTGTSTITSVTDNRLAIGHAGQRLPTVTHLLSTATAIPTIAAGAAAGTSPTVSIGSNSTDLAGTVSITTGTSPGTGTLATITFNVAFAAAPRAILLTPANAAAAGVAADLYANASNVTTAHFTVDAATALAASTAYQWFFAILG
jgi:hypothetical protein